MSQFFSQIRDNTVWVIGINQLFECGETLKPHNNNDHTKDFTEDDNDEDYCNTLTLCKWSKNIQNITKINRGYGFNIYTSTPKDDEFVINGFMKSCQKLLPDNIIPKDVMLLCLTYLGHHNIYYSAGDNNHGSCGLGYLNHDPIQKITPIPVKLNNISKVCIGSGGQSVIWIASDGCVYLNGANYNNQLGLMQHKQAISTPTLSTFFKCKSLDCTDAASSNNYSMIVCNDGSVWSSGKGYFGELGHGSIIQETSQFIAIGALQKYHILNVCTGSLFSLFLDEDGTVWSCGRNEIGQCGLAHFDTDAGQLPTRINFPKKDVKIKKIKCGMEHSIAMDVCGDVYCWGSNEYGQCGINTVVGGEINDKINVPTLSETFSVWKQSVINIKAGSYHSGSVTGCGKYYIWGCNDYNECCLNLQEKEELDLCEDDNYVFIPHCINSYVNQGTSCENIVDMSLGDCNTMIIVSQPIFL